MHVIAAILILAVVIGGGIAISILGSVLGAIFSLIGLGIVGTFLVGLIATALKEFRSLPKAAKGSKISSESNN